MKIELKNNRVFFENHGLKKEIHPFWLRERVNGDTYVDKGTSHIVHKSFQLLSKTFSHRIFEGFDVTSIFKRQPSLKNSVTHENVVCGSEQTIYK